ncbi:unnamed protein product, partial [Staurois parvus]
SGTQRDSSCGVWPSTAPTQLSRDIGFTGTQGVVCAHNRASSGHGWSVHIAGTVQNTGGRCAQQGQFRTRVVWAHNKDSSGHGGGRCTQQGQFRTRVVCAHTT